MARGRRTNLQTAATAKALSDFGYNKGLIAEKVGLPYRTVDSIIRGEGKWSEIIRNEPLFEEYRKEIKAILQIKSLYLADRCLDQIEKKLSKASAPQAAVTMGILRQHQRLDAGESTVNIAQITRHEIEQLDELAEKLSWSLLAHKQQTKEEP